MRKSRVVLATAIAVAAPALWVPAAQAAPPQADMSLENVSSPPAEAAPGDSFEVTGTVRNSGGKASRAAVSAALVDDERIVVGEHKTPGVPRDRTRNFAFDATIPAETAPGSYEFEVCVLRRGTSGARVCVAAPIEVGGEAFEPGARTLGDPIFPQTGNGGYDVLHYDIELDYDPATNLLLDGTKTTITAEATQGLSELSLDFQPLDVSTVAVDGIPAGFGDAPAEPELSSDPAVTQPHKLIVTPAAGIPDGTTFELEISYTGEPVEVIDADLSSEGWIRACYPDGGGTVCDGGFTVNQPNGSQGWFPGNHFPTDKATFDTSITVPTGKTAFGMGELSSMTPNIVEGTTTWNWTSEEPAASYLATATNGDFDYPDGTFESSFPEVSTGREILTYNGIDSSAPQAQKDSAAASIRRMRGQLNFLTERVFGPYPFSSMGVVADRVAGVGYALENQTKAHFAGPFSGSGVSVAVNTLLHEVGHQWIGNSVAIKGWRDLWFNEGWATWMTWYWAFEDNSSTTSPADQLANNYANVPAASWERPPALLEDPADLFDTFPTYTRGAMMLEAYRQIVGDSTFFAFAGELASEFEHGNISTAEFVDFALEQSGLEGAELELLEEFFDQWLFGTERPDLTPEDF